MTSLLGHRRSAQAGHPERGHSASTKVSTETAEVEETENEEAEIGQAAA